MAPFPQKTAFTEAMAPAPKPNGPFLSPTTTVAPAVAPAVAPDPQPLPSALVPNSSYWNPVTNSTVDPNKPAPTNPLLATDWASGLISQANLDPTIENKINSHYSVGLAMAERDAQDAYDNYSKLSKEQRKQYRSPAALYNAVLGERVATLRDQTDQAIMLNAGSGGTSARGSSLAQRLGYQQAMQQWLTPMMKSMSPEMAAAARVMTAAAPAMADLRAAAQASQNSPQFLDPYAQAITAAMDAQSSGGGDDFLAALAAGGKKKKK